MAKSSITKYLFKGDLTVWIIFMLLCCFSIVEVFSASSTLAYRHTSIWMPIVRHATFLTVGFLIIVVLTYVPSDFFPLGVLLIPVSVILLAITFVWGIQQNDAARRLELFGTVFQPSELGKLACIIFVAFLLSERGKSTNDKTFRNILFGVVPICVLILESNLSTAFILGSVCFLMMFIGRIPLKKLGSLLVATFILGLIFVLLLLVVPKETTRKYVRRAETWQNRLELFIENIKNKNEADNTTLQTTSDDYQVIHAKIAIARGGIIGKGPGQSVQRDFLPQAYDDFIYAIIIEELGVFFGFFILFLYVVLTFRAGAIAGRCKKIFPKYLVVGCSLIILIQALVNMAVAVNLIPVTGQPLPLISQGGTSIIVTCIYIGMILRVSRENEKMVKAEETEETEEIGEDEEIGEIESNHQLSIINHQSI